MANPNGSPWLVFTVTGELDLSRLDELDEMVGTALCSDCTGSVAFDVRRAEPFASWCNAIQDIDELTAELAEPERYQSAQLRPVGPLFFDLAVRAVNESEPTEEDGCPSLVPFVAPRRACINQRVSPLSPSCN